MLSPGRDNPLVMGIVNVTPDSFSDGGLYLDADAAVGHAHELSEDGAAIVDVGGESTRPGAEPVPVDEEIRRVVPVIERIATAGGPVVSVDTQKLPVAEAALQAGARIVNDISAFRASPDIAAAVARAGAWCCLMHMRGEPRTMQESPRYDDVVSEVKRFLEERLGFAVGEGIGFGKTADHNVELLRRLDEIAAIGRPVLVGASRKSFLGRLTGRAEREREPATIAASVLAYERGASILRVHEPRGTVDALAVALAVARRP